MRTEMKQNQPVILSAVRTPIGRLGGALASLTTPELGALVVREALRRAGVAPDAVDEVILGHVIQAGAGPNPARQAAIKAGLPDTVPAWTVNQLCLSGLRAVALAAQAVESGEAEIVVAGGMESMSHAPFLLDGARWGYRLGDGMLRDALLCDGLMDPFQEAHMGCLVEGLARRYGLTREEQDAFAARSQRRCAEAQAAGRFTAEIVPVEVRGPQGQVTLVDTDEHPRPETTVEVLAKLKPAFEPDGTITPGNASGLNDGAAAVVVTTADRAAELGRTPLACLRSFAVAARAPEDFGVAPAGAIARALERAGLSLAHLDLIEANEAFAAQTLALGRDVGWDWEKVNVHGGAIALGHPIGASGARILVTLLYALLQHDGRFGLATLCGGGGLGAAMVVTR